VHDLEIKDSGALYVVSSALLTVIYCCYLQVVNRFTNGKEMAASYFAFATYCRLETFETTTLDSSAKILTYPVIAIH
jgi:hypothetical protein